MSLEVSGFYLLKYSRLRRTEVERLVFAQLQLEQPFLLTINQKKGPNGRLYIANISGLMRRNLFPFFGPERIMSSTQIYASKL